MYYYNTTGPLCRCMIENDRHMTTRALELMTNALFAQRQDRIQFFFVSRKQNKVTCSKTRHRNEYKYIVKLIYIYKVSNLSGRKTRDR